MKRQLTTSAFVVVLCSFQFAFGQVKQVKQTEGLYMRGAYTMLKQTIDSGTGPNVLNVQQFKIYTDKYIMYAHRRSQTDSLAAYGIGTYTTENGKVIETMFYSASGPVNATFTLDINQQEDGYSQVINFPVSNPGQKFILTEEYKLAGKRKSSPLDGAWKQIKYVDVSTNGKSTTNENPIQFKIYESGHFMWTHTDKDPTSGTYVSLYGYGTFEMPTPGEIIETATSSTFSTLLEGKPVTLKIRMLGKDRFEQTITRADGSKMIETYERMK